MTNREKDAIRVKPCALCLAVPPFADGSRCHPHRIIRAKDGGKYVEGNVIPLCPPCHREVDRVAMITAALYGGQRCRELQPTQFRDMGRKGGVRRHELHPESAKKRGRELGSQYGSLLNVNLTALEHSARSKRAVRIRTERQHREGLTEKELEHMREMARKGARAGGFAVNAKYTPEERSERARRREAAKPVAVRVAATRAANRAAMERLRRNGPTLKQLVHLRAIAHKGNLASQAKRCAMLTGAA